MNMVEYLESSRFQMVRQRIGRVVMVWLVVMAAVVGQLGFSPKATVVAQTASGIRLPFEGSAMWGITLSTHIGKSTNAIDFFPASDQIMAVEDGKVIYSGFQTQPEVCPVNTSRNLGYGNLIILYHPNTGQQSYYAHLSSIQVSVGDSVKKGQVIGVEGSTGCSSGNHLHFELREWGGETPFGGSSVSIMGVPGMNSDGTSNGGQSSDYGSGSNPSQPAQPGDYGSGSNPSQPGNSGSDNSKFINDLNYPDGSVVIPGHTFKKLWRIYNNGGTTWGEGYTAVRTSGSYGPASFKIPATAPGKYADIGASFTAPSTFGLSRATYYLQNPSGQTFGEPFWVELNVQITGSVNKIIAPTFGKFYVVFTSVESGCTGNFGSYSPLNQTIFRDYKKMGGLSYEVNRNFSPGEEFIFYLQPLDFCTGPIHLSTDPKQALVTRQSDTTWYIGWEDLPYNKSDKDYNDLVAEVGFTPQDGPAIDSPVSGLGTFLAQAKPTVVAQTPKPRSQSFLTSFFNIVKELFRPRAPSPAPMKQAASTSPQIVGYFDHSKLYTQTGTVYTSTLGVYTSTLNYLGHQSKPKASGSTYSDLADSSSPYALTANGNDGTDFLLKAGDSIVAGVEGVITATGQISTYCTLTKHYTFTNFVKVQHASGSTLEYHNLGKIKDGLPIGTKVLTDTVLGYAGPTNCTKESIFHFVVRSAKGLALDPFGWQPSADSVWQNTPDPSQPFELAQSFITKRKPLWVTPAEAVAILETTGTTVITSTSKRILVSAPSTVYSNRPLRLELVENPMPASVPGEETKLSFSLQGYGAWDQPVKQLNGLVTIDVTVPASQAANPALQKLAYYKRGEGQFAALQGSLQSAGSTWAIQRWDETKGSWQPLYTTYDAKTGHAQAQTYQLGTFTLGTTSNMPSAAPKLPTNTPTRTPIAPELTATAGGATLTPEVGNVTPSVPELTATAGGETLTPAPNSVPSPSLTNTPNVPEITATAGGATLTPSPANTPNVPEITATAGGATLTPVSTHIPNAPEQTATVSGQTLTPSPTNTPNAPELTATAGGSTLTPSPTNTPNAPELTATAGGPTLTPSPTSTPNAPELTATAGGSTLTPSPNPTGTPSVAGKGKEVFLPLVKR